MACPALGGTAGGGGVIAKAIRWILGLLALPICVGYSLSFYDHLLGARRVGGPEISLLLGITAYLAVHVLLGAPTRAYVFGHELTHATAAWMSGGQVKGMKVGAKKGSVALNKITAFIALAPYLIPVYGILVALAYGIAGLFTDVRPWIHWFFFGLGAALVFHLVFTVEALKQKQSDLEVLGPLLSLVVIFWANVTLVIGVMNLVVPEIQFVAYLTDGFARSRELYLALYRQLFAR